MNASSERVAPLVYKNLKAFGNGFAAKKDSLWGVFDAKGQRSLPFQSYNEPQMDQQRSWLTSTGCITAPGTGQASPCRRVTMPWNTSLRVDGTTWFGKLTGLLPKMVATWTDIYTNAFSAYQEGLT